MVDIATLLSVLTPAIPFLVGVTGKISEGFTQAVGEDVWNKLKAILGSRLLGHPIASPAIEQLKQEPDNANLQAVVQLALKDLLEKDAQLVAELKALLKTELSDAAIHVEINSNGDHNINVGVNYGQMSP